jgi:uncharacterized protein (DUF305 family)
MKQRDPLLYGIIGALVGAALVWFLATNAINNNSYGMMRMMGIRTQNSTTQNGYGMMSNNLDQHFIEEMIPHHQDAITMADIALQKAQHQEIKTLATNIKTSQSAEITKMKNWYKNWYGSEVPLENENDNSGVGMMGGQMHGGMMGNDTDTSGLENASNFDKTFIEEMIPHHQMAVMMANMLLQGTNRPEMKQLAKDIINAQTKEINQMRQWYTDWGYAQ